jgi:RNA polymerase sigma-70 factor (ECF subfamily)
VADDQAPEDAAARDRAAVARFLAGDRTAFSELVRRYQRPIVSLALRYVADPAHAEDIAQRAFVRAFQKLGGFRGDAPFRAWVFRIAINLSLNHLRSRTRAREAPLAAVEAQDRAEPVDFRAAQKVRAAVAALPPKQRMAVELRMWEGMTFQEVAEVMRSSEDSAKANYHHALRRLRAALDDEVGP